MTSYVVHNEQGKVVGTVEGTTYTTRRDSRIHQLRKPPAWAVDMAVIDKHVRNHCKTIEIVDIRTGNGYTIPVDTFIAHAIRLNRGYGWQYAVALSWWRPVNKEQGSLL